MTEMRERIFIYLAIYLFIYFARFAAILIHASFPSVQEEAKDNQITCSGWGKVIKSSMS